MNSMGEPDLRSEKQAQQWFIVILAKGLYCDKGFYQSGKISLSWQHYISTLYTSYIKKKFGNSFWGSSDLRPVP